MKECGHIWCGCLGIKEYKDTEDERGRGAILIVVCNEESDMTC